MSSRYPYSKIISNDYLELYKEVKGPTPYEVEMKCSEQLKRWAERETRERHKVMLQDLKVMAEEKTTECQELIDQYSNLLSATLAKDDRIDWKSLFINEPFPPFLFTDKEPTHEEIATELKVPPKKLLEFLFKSIKAKRLGLEEKARTTLNERKQAFEKRKQEVQDTYDKEKSEHDQKQKNHNDGIDQFKANFEAGDPLAIENYVRLVLQYSEYPEPIEKEYDVQYDSNSQTVVIDYQLPNPDEMPKVAAYKFSVKDKDVKTVLIKKKEFEALYESTVYQIVLRTIHEVFEAVYTPFIQAAVFNGWVEGTDLATGIEFRSCLVSCQVQKDELMKINLGKVDPKLCFRSLKGLIAGPLYNLAPVKPIMVINREDARFIESREILAEIESIPNLATMDWTDFEHLVRELFEKLFQTTGGEVRVTRASRDWGVDAIAFDPDPIRGGKFLIQAKRYNNLVPVSAVRDLYGAMMNERAARGLLVTTSYFGNESREFAKDKPITLIDGAGLIHMFQEQGYNVRIELKNREL